MGLHKESTHGKVKSAASLYKGGGGGEKIPKFCVHTLLMSTYSKWPWVPFLMVLNRPLQQYSPVVPYNGLGPAPAGTAPI